jgi:acyl-CoA thioesterase
MTEKGRHEALPEKGRQKMIKEGRPQEAVPDKEPYKAIPEKGPHEAGSEKGPRGAVSRRGPEEEMTGEQRIQALGGCPFARLLGMEILETWPGGARVAMEATGKENFLGVAHGGAVFALADQAFAAAANRGEFLQVAVSVHIHYLSPAKGRLEAVARLIAETDRTSHILVEVKSGERLVATFEGVAYKA